MRTLVVGRFDKIHLIVGSHAITVWWKLSHSTVYSLQLCGGGGVEAVGDGQVEEVDLVDDVVGVV